jgi:hypothetical protein
MHVDNDRQTSARPGAIQGGLFLLLYGNLLRGGCVSRVCADLLDTVAQGTFRANPIVHIHGLAFFAWTLFFVYQTWLAASGRLARHRAVGLIGVSFAIGNVRRPEWHKRLLLVATISMLEAAIARWFFVFLAPAGPPGPPPVAATFQPAVVTVVLLLIGIVHDWRQRGCVHPATLVGGGAYVALKLVQLPLSTTPAWHAVAHGVLALAG